ncbi:unnamed protein product, partial [Ilex paraguariensis]
YGKPQVPKRGNDSGIGGNGNGGDEEEALTYLKKVNGVFHDHIFLDVIKDFKAKRYIMCPYLG